MRKCSKCEIEKDESEFSRKPDTKDGLQPKCKECVKEYNKIYRINLVSREKKNIENKKCGKCEEIKDVSCFGKYSYSSDGFSYVCRECRKLEYQREAENLKQYRLDNLEEKRKYDKEYYSNNKEKKKEYAKKNKEHKLEYQHDYYLNNKEKYLEFNRQWRRKKRQSDPCYRLRCNVARMIHAILRENKKGSILQYLPYTMRELKEYLESKFEPWMNWDNYGRYKNGILTWQIDHIIAQSNLPFDSMEHPNFLKCWELSNLRPLETLANIKKGNK